ncbi:hypothetical protein BGZ54_001251, partial [Gamsiella multidivaricata]
LRGSPPHPKNTPRTLLSPFTMSKPGRFRRESIIMNILPPHTPVSLWLILMMPPGYVIGQVATPRIEEPEEPLYVNAKQVSIPPLQLFLAHLSAMDS